MAAFVRDPTESIRENVIRALQARLMEVQAIPDVEYKTLVRKVHRRPLDKAMLTELGNATKTGVALVAIHEQDERTTGGATSADVTTSEDRVNLRVLIEIHVRVLKGAEPATVLNRAFSDLYRSIMRDPTFDDLALDAFKRGTEADVGGDQEATAGGLLSVELVFQHKPGDDRALVWE